METKIIIQDGVAVSPLYKDKILLSNYYLGKPLITNATAVASSGGQLVANGYYYKIVALCDKHIVIDGDTATQLSGLSIDIISTTAQKLHWELTNSGTTRKFELFVGNEKVATGTRTGDGVLTFTEVNNSGIRGTVTVTFTAQDIDSGNILTINRNYVVESDEVLEFAAGADLTIDLAWDAVIDKPTSIYVYRGTSTGSYDGYFLLGGTAVTFSDDGTRIFDYDTSIDKTRQIVVERQFLPEGYVAGVWHPCSNRLAWRYAGDHCVSFINCNAVINKYTWVGSLETYNIAAFNEFTSWL